MTDQLDDFLTRARAWLSKNLASRAGSPPLQDKERFSPEYLAEQRRLQAKLHDGGFAGITWPKKYGGQGLPADFERAFLEEASEWVLPDLGVLGGATYRVCGPLILEYASESFNAEHIPRMLRGDELWAQFFSEPDAGSDLAAVTTRAIRTGDDWVINGSKIWTSQGDLADYGLCLARTDTSKPKHQGLTWFAIPTSSMGFEVGRIRQSDGTAGFCEEFFTDLIIPDDHRIGDVNDGWSITRKMLVYERDAGIYKDQIDLSPGPLPEDLVELAQQLPGGEDAAWARQVIAKAHVNAYAMRQVASRVGQHFADSSVNPAALAAYGKLAAGTFIPMRAHIGLILAGSPGIAWAPDDVSGKAAAIGYLNGRTMSIAGGTNEIQRNAIAEKVLGLPREPRADIEEAGDRK